MRSVNRILLALLPAFSGACGDPDEGGAGPVVAGSTASQADAFFDESVVHDVHLTMSPADWQTILDDSMGDTYRRAAIQWRDHVVRDVGVRPRGHSTRHPGNPKYSLKIEMDAFVPDQEFLGLDEVKLDGLREVTLMRERIAYGVFRDAGLAAPRSPHCRLFVNGEYRGVYMIEEVVNRDLVKHRFGPEKGNLYHVYVGEPEAYAYRGSSPSLYMDRPWGPVTNEDGDHSVLPRFLDVVNHRPHELESVCHVQDLLTYLALEVAILSRDGFLRDNRRPQNHFAYWRPSTARFTFIPWDLDQCLTDDRVPLSLWHNFGHSAVTRAVRDTPEFNARFRQRLAEVLQRHVHPDRMAARIDEVFRQIRPAVYEDTHKIPTNEQFDRYRQYLKDVFRARYERLRAELAGT